MRIRKVLGDKIATPLVNLVFLPYNLDSPSTTGGRRLQNIHVFEIVHLSVVHPPLVVLRENVCCRSYFEIPSVLPPLFLHISPHVGFRAKTPSIWEMIDFLIWVHMLQLAWSNESWPHTVPRHWSISRSNQMESSSFQCIDDTVVNVSLANSEC